MFFVCLDLKHTEQNFGGYKKKIENLYFSVETMKGRGRKKKSSQISFTFVCLGLKHAETKMMRGREHKKKFKTSITFFVCLGLKRAEKYFGEKKSVYKSLIFI